MTDESFKEDFGAAIQNLLIENEPVTMYLPVQNLNYFSKPCELKILWKSPDMTLQSFAFPKGSPLLPFFKYVYKKLRQTGVFKQIGSKWKRKESKCVSNGVKSISLINIGSLCALLFFGFLSALLIFLTETIGRKHGKKTTKCQRVHLKIGSRMVKLQTKKIV